MEFLGDLERAFAEAIYPNRLLVAGIGLVGLAVVVALARRGRWDLAARRHPRRTAGGLILALVIIGPVGWYLGSPLVLSSTVDEPPPVAAATMPSVAPSGTPQAAGETTPGDLTPSATPSDRATSADRSGSFRGADEFHFGRGLARLIETAPGEVVVRLEDFEVRNGPDLYVYLSPSADGYAPDAVELGRLKADRGNQNYAVPAGTDVSRFGSVIIWCKQFAVLFATAPLS